MNFDKIFQFFSRNKKNIFWIAIFIIGFFLFMESAIAGGSASSSGGVAATSKPAATWAKDTAASAIWIIDGALKLMSALLWALTALISLFLSPNWTSWQIFGMQEPLRQIWILVSNVVYFIFALILIVIAFMNILNQWDKWELKQALPKFIVWVLIVPFSWFFVQFVVSLSAILTVGVLTLPYDTFQSYPFYERLKNSQKEDKNMICTHPIVNLWEKSNSDKNCEEWSKKSILEIFEGDNIFGVINIYTYGILWLWDLNYIKSELTKAHVWAIKDIFKLSLKVIFDIIFVIVYFILMMALFLALLVRWIWLWVYMMLSPAFGLLYFFWKAKEWVGDGDSKFGVGEFIALALVPVYVSAALSFGLLFIFVATDGLEKWWKNGKVHIHKGKNWWEVIEVFWDFAFTIKWYQWKGLSWIVAWWWGALWTLIIELFGIAILWIAVMAALKQSQTTKAITAPIAFPIPGAIVPAAVKVAIQPIPASIQPVLVKT